MRPLQKTVGILGGMGPEATVEFMRRLIASVPARDDEDHLHMLVDNNPKVPSRIRSLIEKAGEDPAPVLVRMAQGLERAGADFLAMPCNTAHAYRSRIQAAVSIPLLDMIGLSVAALARMSPRPKKIGLLASPAVLTLGLFTEPLAAAGLALVAPTQAEATTLLAVIRSVKAGQTREADCMDLQSVADALAARGADAFLVACSEFSLLPPPQGRAVLDTLDVLVQATFSAAE